MRLAQRGNYFVVGHSGLDGGEFLVGNPALAFAGSFNAHTAFHNGLHCEKSYWSKSQ